MNTHPEGKVYLNGKLIEDPVTYFFSADYEKSLDEDTKAYMEDLIKEFLSWDEEAKSNNTESEQQ